MKLLLFLFISFLSLTVSFGQLALETTWKTDANKLAIDNLGNCYLYNSNKIDKFDIEGTKIATYSNNQLGEIEKIDVTNPLKNLVLHKSQNTLVVLDNTLSSEQNNTLDLTQANLYNTTAYTYSAIDNGIWFYDQELFQIIKTDVAMNRIYESGNLLRLLNLKGLSVDAIFERKNKLFVTTQNEVIVFDNYGAYYSTIQLKNATVIGIEENNIYSFNNGLLKAYNTKTFEEQEIKTTFSKGAIVSFKKNKVYAIDNGVFSTYSIQN